MTPVLAARREWSTVVIEALLVAWRFVVEPDILDIMKIIMIEVAKLKAI
jgi:hypothetical protein